MNTFTIRYYDRNPLDPQARWEIHRANVQAEIAEEARIMMELCECEIIDVTPFDEIAYQYGKDWEKMADALRAAYEQMELEQIGGWLCSIEPAALPHAIYDFTPAPGMPTIDFNKIEEIEL